LRVLLVEDDSRLASAVGRALERQAIAVDHAPDGEQATAAAALVGYDVIVLDRMLPGRLDGLDVSRRLRNGRVGTPILMLTALDGIDDRVAGLEAGADDYLVKPFAMRELVARLRALARRHLPERSALLRHGEIVVNTASHAVSAAGREVELTAKEYAILEYFLLQGSRLLTREQIVGHVWNNEFEGGADNLVEVYIGRLRRKLTAAGAADPFVTVRGSGYRLAPA
jgi:DNA-binding response OmpR family regulator